MDEKNRMIYTAQNNSDVFKILFVILSPVIIGIGLIITLSGFHLKPHDYGNWRTGEAGVAGTENYWMIIAFGILLLIVAVTLSVQFYRMSKQAQSRKLYITTEEIVHEYMGEKQIIPLDEVVIANTGKIKIEFMMLLYRSYIKVKALQITTEYGTIDISYLKDIEAVKNIINAQKKKQSL